MDTARLILETIAQAGILLFEFIGVGVVLYTGILSLYKYVTKKPGAKLFLAKGLAMGLQFKMGGEILRTVIVQDWHEIAIVGGIILLRAAMAFLIHWELTQEGKAGE